MDETGCGGCGGGMVGGCDGGGGGGGGVLFGNECRLSFTLAGMDGGG